MGAIERYSFKRVKTNGGYKYYVNGIEVSQTEYNRKSAEAKAKTEALKESAKKGQEDLLGSTLEEHQKMTSEERINKLRKEMESFKEGGDVKKKKINSKAIAKKYFKGIF